ncbi:MAG: hypothetical protein HY514_04240 [Candidatus Aenigmarchaeota archaeon]|nr:hypothetical protein [Candidatus Aenigmarchaeota archaeon]
MTEIDWRLGRREVSELRSAYSVEPVKKFGVSNAEYGMPHDCSFQYSHPKTFLKLDMQKEKEV